MHLCTLGLAFLVIVCALPEIAGTREKRGMATYYVYRDLFLYFFI